MRRLRDMVVLETSYRLGPKNQGQGPGDSLVCSQLTTWVPRVQQLQHFTSGNMGRKTETEYNKADCYILHKVRFL